MPLSEFSAPSLRMPAKENSGRRRSQPSVTIQHESLPGVKQRPHSQGKTGKPARHLHPFASSSRNTCDTALDSRSQSAACSASAFRPARVSE
jgi:hypothetical protein